MDIEDRLNLEGAIYGAIRELNAEDDEWDKDQIHASDLSIAIVNPDDAKCSRNFWYRMHGVKGRKLGPGELLMFRHGNRIHEDMETLIERALPEGWTIIGREIAVKLDGATGRLDYLLGGPNGERVIIDIKTVRGGWFRYDVTKRPADERQVQTYLAKLEADYGILLYVDREGQNGIRQFFVERADEEVRASIRYAKAIAALEEPPPVMEAVVKIKRLKGPDSVYIELPWQCRYCSRLDVVCPGALAPGDRKNGVVGKVLSSGFTPTVAGLSDEAIALIEAAIENRQTEEGSDE